MARIFQRFIPLRLTAAARYFPTLDPQSSAFAVINLHALLEYLQLRGPTAITSDFEAIVSLESDTFESALLEIRGLFPPSAEVNDRVSLEERSMVDPLTVAGWQGVSVVTIALATLLAVIVLASYLLAQFYRGSHQWAVLRALGFRRSAFPWMVAIEHLAAAAVGAAAGTVAGVVTGRVTVAVMSRTDTGADPLPPFDLVTQWWYASLLYVVVAAVGLIGMLIVLRAVPHLPVSTIGRDVD